ncbi:MAG: phosphoglycerate kinase, partial [Parcubacteria group bacterium QH_9_35_7]
KIKASVPTIEYLVEKGAKVILVTHLDRPGGEVDENLRVDSLADKLSEFLEVKVNKLNDFTGEDVRTEVDKMKKGEVIMLENIRFSPDERKNSGKLAQQLADLADIFVIDGFGITHRDHSSVSGVAEKLPAYSGLLLEKEIKNLDKVLSDPPKPFCLAMGGVKVKTKLPVIEKMADRVDYILTGGGILNTYLASENIKIGSSVYGEEFTKQAQEVFQLEEMIRPLDVTVGKKGKNGSRVEYLSEDKAEICTEEEMILDLGPKTIGKYQDYLEKSNTILFNGAMGLFEQEPFQLGTQAILESIVRVSDEDNTFTVIGGGETVQSLELVEEADKIDFISTGGGAMLHYLTGEELPGLKYLEK